MMKTPGQLLIFLLILLSACSGSDTYQGSWKATDTKGNKYEIVFTPKHFDIKDSAGTTTGYNYTQNKVAIKNSVETYGIRIEDGRNYQIHFPKPDDESVGIIQDENGMPLYTIGRKAYLGYEELYQLK